MSRYVLDFTIPGSLAAFVAQPRVIATAHTGLRVLRVDLTVTDAPPGNVVARIGDGTQDETVTLGAAATHVSDATVSAEWPAGAEIELELTAAAGGFNLSAQVFVEELGAAQSSAGLVSVADAKTALGITTVDADRDAWLGRSIDALSARIRGYCLQHITRATYIDTFRFAEVAHLRGSPVHALTSATLDGQALDVAELLVDRENGRLWRLVSGAVCDWGGDRVLEVVYAAGFDPLPADLAELVYSALGRRYEGWLAGTRGLGGVPGVSRIQFADGAAITYDTAAAYGAGVLEAPDYLLGFPLSMLDPWRDVRAAYAPNSSQLWDWYTP